MLSVLVTAVVTGFGVKVGFSGAEVAQKVVSDFFTGIGDALSPEKEKKDNKSESKAEESAE